MELWRQFHVVKVGQHPPPPPTVHPQHSPDHHPSPTQTHSPVHPLTPGDLNRIFSTSIPLTKDQTIGNYRGNKGICSSRLLCIPLLGWQLAKVLLELLLQPPPVNEYGNGHSWAYDLNYSVCSDPVSAMKTRVLRDFQDLEMAYEIMLFAIVIRILIANLIFSAGCYSAPIFFYFVELFFALPF